MKGKFGGSLDKFVAECRNVKLPPESENPIGRMIKASNELRKDPFFQRVCDERAMQIGMIPKLLWIKDEKERKKFRKKYDAWRREKWPWMFKDKKKED